LNARFWTAIAANAASAAKATAANTTYRRSCKRLPTTVRET